MISDADYFIQNETWYLQFITKSSIMLHMAALLVSKWSQDEDQTVIAMVCSRQSIQPNKQFAGQRGKETNSDRAAGYIAP